MAEETRGRVGDAERESRFVHLLQPSRDMATNWSVDVGKQLESYLDELKATGLFDDGDCPLNFAEAALLIQGSIQVYSRKVEYLYNLVLQALEFLAQKKQGQEGNNSSSAQEDVQECDTADEGEENFLTLDDEIPEEADIDVLDREGEASLAPSVKVPTSLLVTDAECFDTSGGAGELASYNVATCTMYKDFLLLDPCDTDTVDKYLESEGQRRRDREGDPAVPSSSVPAGNPVPGEGSLGTPGRPDAATVSAERNGLTPPIDMTDAGQADWEGDEGMMWNDIQMEDAAVEPPQAHPPHEEDPGVADPEGPDDPCRNPWTPLNPHEPGTLLVRPFRKGRTQRKHKPEESNSPDHLFKRYGLFCPEFAKAMRARERQEKTKRRGKDQSVPANSRGSSQSSCGDAAADPTLNFLYENGLDGTLGDSDGDENPWDGQCDATDHIGDDGLAKSSFPSADPQPAPAAEEDFCRVPQNTPGFEQQAEGGGNMSLEDLCRAHVDSVLQELAESQVRSGLTARVATWKKNIEDTLNADESRPPFDIHEVGERLLTKLATSAATSRKQGCNEEVCGSFTLLVRGQPKEQVARSFSALLQLVNNGNVSIMKESGGRGSCCFTAENPFQVKLLDSQNYHERMFQHIAPANAQKVSSRNRSHQSGPQSDHVELAQRVISSERRSPSLISYSNTPSRVPRMRSPASIPISPASVRRSSRKRGQSVTSRGSGTIEVENRSGGTPDKGYTPVKLTPNRRQSKRKPLQVIQV